MYIYFCFFLFLSICSTLCGSSKYPLNTVDYRNILDRPIVINLNRHIHRYETTKQLMEKAGFTNIERFEAIDGFYVEDQFFEKLGIFQGGQGQKGCAASHLLVWENFLEDPDREFLFIAEDDMLPHSDFYKLFPLYWQLTPTSFDIVLVGNQMHIKPSHFWLVKELASCLHAYIISKQGAKKLLELYKQISKHPPKENTCIYVIDIFLVEAMSKRQIKFYCYNGSSFPDLPNIHADNIFHDRDTGICFQNRNLGSSIHCRDIVP